MSSRLGPSRIVMIEDNPVDQKMTLRALERVPLPNQVDTFTRAEEALVRLRGDQGADLLRPELILLDLNLPGMNGREFLQEIKSDPALKRIPVVALTSSDAEADVLGAWDLGVVAYLIKPVTLPRLTELMERLTHFYFDDVVLPSYVSG